MFPQKGNAQCFPVSHRIRCAFPPTLLLMLHNLTFPQLTPSRKVPPVFLLCRQTEKPCMHAFSYRCVQASFRWCVCNATLPIVNATANFLITWAHSRTKWVKSSPFLHLLNLFLVYLYPFPSWVVTWLLWCWHNPLLARHCSQLGCFLPDKARRQKGPT